MTARKFLAMAGAVALSAGMGLGLSLTADASSFGCTLSDGCGTLHTTGTDLGGNTQAWDAKYQNPLEMVIGYPDRPGDSAPDFDLVRHEASHVTGFGPDASLVLSHNAAHLAFGSGVTAAVTYDGSQFVITFTGLTAADHYQLGVSSNPFTALTTGTFTGAQGNGGASFPYVIAGKAITPGHYHVTLTLTDQTTPATFVTQAVTADVQAPSHVSHSAYYTMVLAKDGFWSNDCVTDPGSGKLRMEPCTLGHDVGQQFTISSVTAPSVPLNHVNIHAPNTVPWILKNQLSGGFVTANLSVDSSVPQPDSSDSRQLTDHGHNASSAAEQWAWNT